MIDPEDTGDFRNDVARRLRRTREALGFDDQQEFGKEAGLAQSRYSQYENGGRPLTLKAALSLCERYSLTLDWLYRGDPSGLPTRLTKTLKDLRKQHQGVPEKMH